MIYLWVYLAVGAVVMAAMLIEKREIRQEFHDFLVVLCAFAVTVGAWPVALFMRQVWAWQEKRGNAKRAVQRADHLSANYLKHDADAWWKGADLAPGSQPIWRPKEAR